MGESSLRLFRTLDVTELQEFSLVNPDADNGAWNGWGPKLESQGEMEVRGIWIPLSVGQPGEMGRAKEGFGWEGMERWIFFAGFFIVVVGSSEGRRRGQGLVDTSVVPGMLVEKWLYKREAF